MTVRDRNGKLVEGLTRTDFRIFEEDVPQQLSELSLRQVAVDVVLMVDTSSSVVSNLDDFRSAADGFARALTVHGWGNDAAHGLGSRAAGPSARH